MISHRKFLLLLFQLLLAFSFSSAQEKYRSVHWGNDEGLSAEDQNALLRDVNGFMWIATPNGLNRFDGSNFKNYVPDKNKRGSIIDADVNNLIEDSLHNLWAGTGKGVSRYDIRADTFMNFPATQPVNKFSIPFWATKDEVYCLEGGWSLAAYNVHTFKKTFIATISPPEYIGGDVESYHSFYDARTNSLWLPKSYFEGRGVAGLFEFSLSTGKRNSYTWPCFKNIPGHIHRIKDMRYDPKRNVVWISSTDGLLQFTPDDKKFHHIDALNEISNQQNFIYPEGLDLDSQGRVWWCSFPAGPVIYDPLTGTVTSVFADVKKQKQIGYVNLFIYCDPEGMVWTSGAEQSRGIYQVIPASFPVVHYSGDTSKPDHLFNGTIINRIAYAGQGKLWIGVGDELNVFDAKTSSFQLISSEKNLPLFLHKIIGPVCEDTIHQKALFDIFDQTSQVSYLYEMEVATKKCRLVVFKDRAGKTIDPPEEYGIIRYKNGAILVSNIFNKEGSTGIFTVNIDSAIARWIAPVPDNGGSPFTDNKHLLFIQSTNNLTYSNKNGKWTRVASPFDSIAWSAISYHEKDSTYWVGFGDSLSHYDNDLRIIRRYAVEGLAYGDRIFHILPDNRGHVWMRFDRGISWLTIATGKITSLSEKDGFSKRILDGGPVALNDDIYFWGGGLDRLSPDKLVDNYPPSFAYFKSLEINQAPFHLPAGINELKELSLGYNQNKISIETGIINYYTKTGNRIRYKLTGSDENWQFAPANYTIRYEGLRPGHYTLLIQASDAAGDFNGPEKKILINISTPFWQTWWFYTLLGILFIFILYGIYRWRTEALRKQKKVLEQTVTERTSEVVSQKKEIESQRDQVINTMNDLQFAQKQLIQKEKMASLGELTAGIAHEIQNPLNFVNNFSDVNRELIEELKNEKSKVKSERDEKLEDELLNDIKANEEKINHHGKRADAIVKGMLQHSRKSEGIKVATDMNALCDEYLRLSYHGMRARDKSFNAGFETKFDESIPQLNIVPQDIGRVLLNLINNAFYSTNEKRKRADENYKPLISVQTKKINDNIEIIVTDNGDGIAASIREKIFQPFFTTKPTGQGTGLGLSLSYDIVKAHGGEIKVESKEGEYTGFVVVIPG